MDANMEIVVRRRFKKVIETNTSSWQTDYFDRFLRSSESYSEKWLYVENNPVRAGLCEKPDDWPFKGRIYPLTF